MRPLLIGVHLFAPLDFMPMIMDALEGMETSKVLVIEVDQSLARVQLQGSSPNKTLFARQLREVAGDVLVINVTERLFVILSV